MNLTTLFLTFMVLTLIAAFGYALNKLAGRPLTISEKLAMHGIPGGGSTNPPTGADEDAAIAALQAVDASEDTEVGLVLAALAADQANVVSLTTQLTAAVAQSNPTLIATRVAALQALNTANAATIAKMQTALAAPPTA